MKRIEIFKPGRHTAMSGATIEFSESDLKATAEAYDPKLHEAPLVVGHPKLDAPAYGWVKSLAYGGTLNAEPDQVDPAFADLVSAGRYKKISASFFAPNAPGNPKPGVYYLRHVGFLGAAAPAVKGLKSASFAEAEEGVVEFGDWSDSQNASMWRRLREWLIAQFGLDQADKVIPDHAVASLEQAARTDNDPKPVPAFAEPPKENSTMSLTAEQIKTLQDENAALKARADEQAKKDAQFAEREARLKGQEAQIKRANVVTFAGGLVEAGKLLPRDEAPLVEFMAALDEGSVIEFADGAETKKLTGPAWLREFLGRLPRQVDYAERTRPGSGDDKTASFAAPHGYGVDPARLDLHHKALAHQATHPNVSYEAALAAVSG